MEQKGLWLCKCHKDKEQSPNCTPQTSSQPSALTSDLSQPILSVPASAKVSANKDRHSESLKSCTLLSAPLKENAGKGLWDHSAISKQTLILHLCLWEHNSQAPSQHRGNVSAALSSPLLAGESKANQELSCTPVCTIWAARKANGDLT